MAPNDIKISDRLETVWKEAFVGYVELTLRNLSGRKEENRKNLPGS